jgi:hypothetical protein
MLDSPWRISAGTHFAPAELIELTSAGSHAKSSDLSELFAWSG